MLTMATTTVLSIAKMKFNWLLLINIPIIVFNAMLMLISSLVIYDLLTLGHVNCFAC